MIEVYLAGQRRDAAKASSLLGPEAPTGQMPKDQALEYIKKLDPKITSETIAAIEKEWELEDIIMQDHFVLTLLKYNIRKFGMGPFYIRSVYFSNSEIRHTVSSNFMFSSVGTGVKITSMRREVI